MTLESRNQYESSEEFRDKFLETITPGIIPRANFIQWNTIKRKAQYFREHFDFFASFRGLDRTQYIDLMSDALMSADVAMDYITTAFELLGHTGDNYVSNQDYLVFKIFSENEKTYEGMRYIVELLYELGLPNIENYEMEDYFVGVQVGLETHRRKNVGGTAFSCIMYSELEKVREYLMSKGVDVVLNKEVKIHYVDGTTTKTVDFCLTSREKRIGIEVNFYTSSGSKPTEIKRSYGQINSEMNNVNTLLVWVTDGIGYEKMKRSLKEARDIHKNIYNYQMFCKSFKEDAVNYFR